VDDEGAVVADIHVTREAPVITSSITSPMAAAPSARLVRHARIVLAWLWIVVRLALVGATVTVAGMIAYNTRPDAHPDEDVHVDAFVFFETHASMPELNSDELHYSSMGWSRVYTGEIVYLVYGQVGHLIRQKWEIDPYFLYRFMNVALLGMTLVFLFFARCRWFRPAILGLVLICIPQVVYVYSYANSDAWALTWTLLLFVQVGRLIERPAGTWRWYRVGMMMVTAGMVLVSKMDFLLGLLLPAVLVGVHVIRSRAGVAWVVTRLAVPGVIVLVLAGLWNPNVSWHRKAWNEQVAAMREERAQDGRRPSDPWLNNYYMASKGVTYREMLHNTVYLERILQSFYSRFGGWTVTHPQWVFEWAATIGMVGLVLTLAGQLVYRRRAGWQLMTALLAAPVVISINWYGAMWYSLYIDLQPQGRYLFPSLVAVYFLFAGTIGIEAKWYRLVHLMLFVPLLWMSFDTLLYCGAWEPKLQEQAYWSGQG
jgi:hypothetical protein